MGNVKMAFPWICTQCQISYGDQRFVYCPRGHAQALTVCEEIRAEMVRPVSVELADAWRQVAAANRELEDTKARLHQQQQINFARAAGELTEEQRVIVRRERKIDSLVADLAEHRRLLGIARRSIARMKKRRLPPKAKPSAWMAESLSEVLVH